MVGWSLDDARFTRGGDTKPALQTDLILGLARPTRGEAPQPGQVAPSGVTKAAFNLLGASRIPVSGPSSCQADDQICGWESDHQACSLLERMEDSPVPIRLSPLTREPTATAPTPRRPDPGQMLVTRRSSVKDPVGGIPFGSGELSLLDEMCGELIPCTAIVFSTGLYLTEHGSGKLRSFAWSPFSVLIKTDGRCSSAADEAGFALSIPTQGRHLQFACQGPDAAEQRQRGLVEMSVALRSHIRAAFPGVDPAVEPLEDVPETKGRILASYLLLREEENTLISVPYCELRAWCKGFAQLVFYSDETCTQQMLAMAITAKTRIFERSGEDCSSFAVDGHSFCARSFEEKQIWLRALSNVKVKLQNDAPDPSPEELRMFREAVCEKVLEVKATEVTRDMGSAPVLPIPSPRGKRRGTQILCPAPAATPGMDLLPPKLSISPAKLVVREVEEKAEDPGLPVRESIETLADLQSPASKRSSCEDFCDSPGEVPPEDPEDLPPSFVATVSRHRYLEEAAEEHEDSELETPLAGSQALPHAVKDLSRPRESALKMAEDIVARHLAEIEIWDVEASDELYGV